MSSIAISLLICLTTLLFLVWMLRRDSVSLGLPVAYLGGLLLIHVPGAWAAYQTNGIYGAGLIEVGFRLTTIGAVVFLVGVWIARLVFPAQPLTTHRRAATRPPPERLVTQFAADQRQYWLFCLLAGWLLIYGLGAILRIPSLGAVVEKGGAIWMLGVMLALADSLRKKKLGQAVLWVGALAVYPVLMLLLAGFVSYGAAAVMIVIALLAVSAKSYWRVISSIPLIGFVGISLFVNYFAIRSEIRASVWGGAPMTERLDQVSDMLENFEFFNVENPAHLKAVDARLNQNYFVGLSADRLDRGVVDYLYGRSFLEGLISLVPRAIWPDKPVYGGSPEIVRKMTGLQLAKNTSWGVGNVMEFYINFGIPSLIFGFLMLGASIGALDRLAANALRVGDLGGVFPFFLPCVALIQPNGSLVELTGGAAAAVVAGLVWERVWIRWLSRSAQYRRTLPAYRRGPN